MKFQNIDYNISHNQALISNAYKEMYEGLSRKDVKTHWGGTFDVEITFDEMHKTFPYSSFVYYNGKGELVESPIIFPKDKAVLGKRHFFGFEPLLTLSISNPTVATLLTEKIIAQSLHAIRNEENLYAN